MTLPCPVSYLPAQCISVGVFTGNKCRMEIRASLYSQLYKACVMLYMNETLSQIKAPNQSGSPFHFLPPSSKHCSQDVHGYQIGMREAAEPIKLKVKTGF